MSKIASIDIVCYQPVTVSQTIAVLRAAGWDASEGFILYQCFASLDEIGDYQTVPAGEWTAVEKFLEEQAASGKTVEITLTKTTDDVMASFTFGDPLLIGIYIPVAPQLPNCRRCTDFSRLLAWTVCPLFGAGWPILEVRCCDDYR